MLTTLEVTIIAAAGAVSFFLIAAVSIVLILRTRDRCRQNEEVVARQVSSGQRVRLSVGSSNYPQIPEPKTNLRRSTHLPYGIVSEHRAAIPSQGTLAQNQTILINDRPRAAGARSHQKRRRSFRASFSAHSFSLPKTRRQKRIEKAIPLRATLQSPLSAITEHSGTNTSQASPSVGIAELPTETTPKSTPGRDDDGPPIERPTSPQWPLTCSEKAFGSAATTTIPVPPCRNSSMMRINLTGHGLPPTRTSLSQRSISVTSTLSLAPEDPLPPLPSITPNYWPSGRKSRLRLSAASVDTIGSSVLGGGQTSPSQTETDLTSIALEIPPIDLNPTRLQPYDIESRDWEPVAVITTGSPRARHVTKYRSTKPGYGSLRASIGDHSTSQNKHGQLVTDSGDRSSLIPRRMGTTLTTIDARHWKASLSPRANSARSSVSPSVVAALTRTESGFKKGMIAARHSMYEHSSTGTFPADAAILRDVSGNQTSPVRRAASSRPASIASENSFQCDRYSIQTGLSSAFKPSPGSQRRGHKRQNCIRIANFPTVDTSRSASKLPEMTEEEEGASETSVSKFTTIPGLSLIERKGPSNVAASGRDAKISPLLTRPILEPTLWKRPKYSRDPSSESMVSCKRDSDVFRNARYDPNAPNIFTESSTPRRQWPLSPTSPYRARAQPTPPSLKAIQEPLDPDSPTLPMPVISSATLFAHAAPFGPRVSAVQGPRNLTSPGRSPYKASLRPITAQTAGKGEDMRPSVMTLGRRDSDAKDKIRVSQLYHKVDGRGTSGLLDAEESGRQIPVTQPSISFDGVSMATQGPIASKTTLPIPSTGQQWVSLSPSVASTLTVSGLRFSKSRSKMAPSPSVISAGAASIWEDASVRGDSPEPELPISSHVPSPPNLDLEAYETFVGQDKRSQKDLDRESRLTSPQGKGLGLTGVQIQGKVWGTPGSLYDRDGFLKE